MVSFFQYTDAVASLGRISKEYGDIYKSVNGRLRAKTGNPDDVNQLVLNMNSLNEELNKSIETINSYYKEGFGKVVKFFNSAENEITNALHSYAATVKKIEDLSFTLPLAPKNEMEINESQQKKKTIESLNKNLLEIDNELAKLNPQDIENINKISEIQALNEKISQIKASGYTSVQDQYTYFDLNNKKKEVQNIPNLKYLITLMRSMEKFRKEVEDDLLLSYCKNKNIPLPQEFEELGKKINASTGDLKKVLSRQWEENEATFEKARKTDDYFNFLLEITESISYRMETNTIGVSDNYLARQEVAAQSEKRYSSEIDTLIKNQKVDNTIGALLKKRIDSKTWALLSQDQRNNILLSLPYVKENSPSRLVDALESKLENFKTLRLAKLKRALDPRP